VQSPNTTDLGEPTSSSTLLNPVVTRDLHARTSGGNNKCPFSLR
jgi:hypothetical protein